MSRKYTSRRLLSDAQEDGGKGGPADRASDNNLLLAC